MKPGMVGAIGKVARASVQSTASQWRCGHAPSMLMVRELRIAVPKAEAWLRKQKRKAAAELAAREKLLPAVMKALNALPHAGSKAARDPAVMTVGRIAEAAGWHPSRVQGVRDGGGVPSLKALKHLVRVMRELGMLANAQGKGGVA
jgi:hypothetical protein